MKFGDGLLVSEESVNPCILLVEDQPDQVELIQKELESLGYTVIVANNGLAAVEMTAQHLPDLVLMDMRLPKMGGLQATCEIKKNHKTKFIPIIAATANAMPGDRERCLAAGCDDYIAKPFTHRQLGAAIQGLLGKQSK
jgi:CheY-like chemotaxis protein